MSEWREYHLKEIANIIMGQSPSSSTYNEEEVGLPFLQGCADFGKRFPTKKIYCSAPKKIAPRDSILLSVRAPVGSSNRAIDSEYCIGRGLAAIVGASADQNFLEYKIISHVHDLEMVSQGSTFLSINTSDLNELKVFCPVSLPEQRKIARILSTVDEVIEWTEAAIGKYQAIKQGMMHDLFTRGLDHNGKLRPRREEAPELYHQTALGWLPKEWEVVPAEKVCLAVIDCKNRTPPPCEEGCPVIRTPNVRDGEFVYGDLLYTDSESYEIWTKRGKPKPGNVVITREAPVGEVCLIPANMHTACLGQRMMMYQPDPKILNNEFMLVALQSLPVRNRLLDLAGGSTVGHVKVGDIRELLIPLPTTGEQKSIHSRIDKLFRTIKVESKKLGKFQKLKQALMQALLTGRKAVVL
jgi:type I restriction enzyme S subunit